MALLNGLILIILFFWGKIVNIDLSCMLNSLYGMVWNGMQVLIILCDLCAVIFGGSRNSETSSAMRGQSNGGGRGIASPDRGAHDKKDTNNNNNSNHHNNENNKSAASSETAHDSKKGGSSSGSGEAAVAPPVWPPKFVIALTNKEKEEDFIAFKGSKLPQRPKKRAKFIQRTLNVSPLISSSFFIHYHFLLKKFQCLLFKLFVLRTKFEISIWRKVKSTKTVKNSPASIFNLFYRTVFAGVVLLISLFICLSYY